MVRKRIRGCFDSADKLKGHHPAVFCEFLEVFKLFLTKKGISLPADQNPDKIPHDELFKALMSPDAPNELVVLKKGQSFDISASNNGEGSVRLIATALLSMKACLASSARYF
jgi:hypothetical protein